MNAFQPVRKVLANATGKSISEASAWRIPTVRDLLDLYNIRAAKYLSQNFILNTNLLKTIASTLGNDISNQIVLEIGPGPGNLTRSILELPHDSETKLFVVEKDKRFIPLLNLLNDYHDERMNIIMNDVLRFQNVEDIVASHINPSSNTLDNSKLLSYNAVQLIGNLPFNISSPLLFLMLKKMSEKKGLLSHPNVELSFMFQKEVAQRIVAAPNTDHSSRLSVVSQFVCDTEIQMDIDSKWFLPRPEVNACMVKLRKKSKPVRDDSKIYKES
jgi:dimethyladenosine transferase 1